MNRSDKYSDESEFLMWNAKYQLFLNSGDFVLLYLVDYLV